MISFNERPTKFLFFNDRANCRIGEGGGGGYGRTAQYLPPTTVTFRGFIRPPVDRQNNEVAAVWKPAEKWPFFAIACISAYLNRRPRRPAAISLFRKRPLRDVTHDRCRPGSINFLFAGGVRSRGGGLDTIRIAFDCFERGHCLDADMESNF